MKLIKKLIGYTIGFVLIISSWSCANQIPLTGGPKDERPPELDTTTSFKNNQVRFEVQDINLYFDEFVELKNATKQIVVSPPLTYLPITKGRAKKISFEFNENEVLKENATYVINFGESISDYTQGNKLENFTLVFSTGDYIDSLSIKGQVIEAKSQKPTEAYTVMLYENTADSVVFKEKPFYFAKTDKNGLFEIKNLRSDTFKLFVLNDKNLNYTYDPINEEIGFIDELIFLTDTSDLTLEIATFKEKTSPKFIAYEVLNRGLIELEFDEAPAINTLTPIDTAGMSNYRVEKSNDQKINLWYKDISRTTLPLEYRTKENVDTISARINLRSTELLDTIVTLSVTKTNGTIGQHPDKNLIISSSYPIVALDLTQLVVIDTLTKDTLKIAGAIDSTNFRSILLSYDWVEGSKLEVTVLPGFVSDLWGQSNDTLIVNTTIANRTDFGTIEVTTANVPTDTAYIINLYKGEELIISNKTMSTSETFTIDKLIPGEYAIEIIEDINQNGLWDPGIYLQKRQSERIFERISLEKLRENWTLEYQLDIKQLKSNSL